jgi:hypothetical protein
MLSGILNLSSGVKWVGDFYALLYESDNSLYVILPATENIITGRET